MDGQADSSSILLVLVVVPHLCHPLLSLIHTHKCVCVCVCVCQARHLILMTFLFLACLCLWDSLLFPSFLPLLSSAYPYLSPARHHHSCLHACRDMPHALPYAIHHLCSDLILSYQPCLSFGWLDSLHHLACSCLHFAVLAVGWWEKLLTFNPLKAGSSLLLLSVDMCTDGTLWLDFAACREKKEISLYSACSLVLSE